MTNQLNKTPQFRWLLKEKYHLSEFQVRRYIDSPLHDLPKKILKDLQLLESGYPINYLIGWVTFNNCHIDLSKKTLIPRPETEFWVDKVIRKYSDAHPLKVLDLCCGSGCVGISLLKQLPFCTVDFVDISLKALQQTTINLNINNIGKERYCLYHSNLFSSLPPQKYDLILTNPPYVDPTGEFDPSILFEPKVALFAPNHGLAIIKSILLQSPSYLSAKGTLYLEFAYNQREEIRKLVTNPSLLFFRDQYHKYRYLSLTV